MSGSQKLKEKIEVLKAKNKELIQKINKVKRFCKKVGCSSQLSVDEWFLAEEIETLISEVKE